MRKEADELPAVPSWNTSRASMAPLIAAYDLRKEEGGRGGGAHWLAQWLMEGGLVLVCGWLAGWLLVCCRAGGAGVAQGEPGRWASKHENSSCCCCS